MRRWILNGGWISILAVCIFLVFCTYSCAYSYNRGPKPSIYDFEFFTLTAYADESLSVEDTPEYSEDEHTSIGDDDTEMTIIEYGGDFILEDEISLLTQIRDILNVIIHLIILAVSGFIIWFFILRPAWEFIRL